MSETLDALLWPVEGLAEAIGGLARQRGIGRSVTSALPKPPNNLAGLDEESMQRWVALIASHIGVEAEPVQYTYRQVEQMVRGGGPAILPVASSDQPASKNGNCVFLAIQSSNKRQALVLTPDLRLQPVAVSELCALLSGPIETPQRAQVHRMLQEAGIDRPRQAALCQAILNQQIGDTPLAAGWLIRLIPGQSLWQQVRDLRLLPRLSWVTITMIALQLLALAGWWWLGQTIIGAPRQPVWLMAWGLLLLSVLWLQLKQSILQQRLATEMAAAFKLRLMHGLLRLAPDSIRHQGVGQFLQRVMESSAVEGLSLQGGFATLLALIQVVVGITLLRWGIGGWLLPLLALCWLLLLLGGAGIYLWQSRAWQNAYESLTNDLVEQMVGHRTRLAQGDPTDWHSQEDLLLQHYLHRSVHIDQISHWLRTFASRGWQVIGLLGFFLAMRISQPSLLQIVISVGGLLWMQQAFSGLFEGLQNIVHLLNAWRQVEPLLQASAQAIEMPAVALLTPSRGNHQLGLALGEDGSDLTPSISPAPITLLQAQGLEFRYPTSNRVLVRDCQLKIYQHDRLLLAGPSGGGKSTLAALLAGLRSPSDGLLLLRGFDPKTLGSETWRKQVVLAPQFHENHIYNETLAFNLLLGRQWPPSAEDLRSAAEVCRELGLAELLGRMPAGLQQMVGESGWRLSHGERSRIYIARTLLQPADLLIFDESFAALDPETLRLALQCVLRRATTLLVIAHP